MSQRLRAIDDSEKAARRQSILDAAKTLYLADTSALPSVISIARKAGLAKGTVYLYFKTKEEIFLAMLSEDYQTLMIEVIKLLDAPSSPDELVDDLLTTLIRFLDDNPLFMPLASMASPVLEQNVEIKIVGEFKLMLIDKINLIDELFRKAFPQFPEGQCGSLLLHTNALILGLWQMQNWPEKLKPLQQQYPFNTVIPDFKKDLALSLKNLWKGALNSHT
ncbi:TetR family transcriptional regulator [Alkalimarinus sediminis]|uniref:TetR/AcrR family transcriptional regulator n=1 Tax=Alkalimarinus sediminis TaxID=1632866 RepID=A0A9E8KQ13_9ALTE|nr:TetR family transcriptional regulator [Alkalimarinus sediminis]UZW74122.1 TetR/AcrR family transcriptional regulator [Alkalimarinus sediminis]